MPVTATSPPRSTGCSQCKSTLSADGSNLRMKAMRESLRGRKPDAAAGAFQARISGI